jgi:hypothetical protein
MMNQDFRAPQVATGRVADACQPRHRHSELLDRLNFVAKAYLRRQLHVVVDNYATHKHGTGSGLARQAFPRAAALHPDRRVVAEPG